MSAINPFAGYVAQGAQIERAQAADKTRQLRREQILSKDVAARDDELEHQVESAEAAAAIHDDAGGQGGNRRQQRPNRDGKDEPPHLDIKA
jgi:hypothetical protein